MHTHVFGCNFWCNVVAGSAVLCSAPVVVGYILAVIMMSCGRLAHKLITQFHLIQWDRPATFDTFNEGLGVADAQLLLQLQMLLLHFPSCLFLVLKALERKAPLNRFYIKNIAQAIISAAADAADAADVDADAATARINGS